MTIALGVLTSYGAILASDTEESDGYLKSSQNKLRVSTGTHITVKLGSPEVKDEDVRPDGAAVIVGAGNAPYVESATDALLSVCLSSRNDQDADVLAAIGKPLAAFYRDHVVPFASYPANDRPEFALLVGHSSERGQTRVYFTEKTTVQRVAKYKAVGAGAMFAEMLLRRLYPGVGATLREAALVAAYVVFHTKEGVPSCGKFTDIAVLRNGERHYIRRGDIRDLETLFLKHEALESAGFFAAVSSEKRRAQRMAELEREFAAFQADMAKARFRIQRLGDDEDLGEID